MKKITLLTILMVSFLTNAQVVLSEDFEASTSLPDSWINNDAFAADDTWVIGSGGDHPGYTDVDTYLYLYGDMVGNYAYFNSDADSNNNIAENVALESPVFDCTGLTTIVVSFNTWLLPAYGGMGYVEVYNGTEWVSSGLDFSGVDATYGGEQIIDVSTQLSNVSNAKIRFRWTGDWSMSWFIDNVVVQQPQGSAPGACTTPNPLDEAMDVVINQYTSTATDTTYKWVQVGFAAGTGDAATSYDVTYSLNSDLSDPVLVATDYDGTVASNGSLWGTTTAEGWQANTTYYWKVTANNIAGSTDSSTWNFTTGAADPLGVEDFTIEALSVSPNPVKDVITINSPVGFDSVEVYNQLGQLVIESNSSLMNNNRLDLSALNPGMYLIQINADNKSKTVKIIKE